MANKSHLKKLKEGPKAWNKWRRENKSITPDLSKADLSEVNLLIIEIYPNQPLFADLRGYNFSKTNFKKTNLRGANLSEANLSGANLSEADLWEADLRNANLKDAKLQKAILNYARLENANLTKANLEKAELTEAKLKKANLTNANLSEVDADNSIFIHAKLSGANLSKAKMMNANCAGADFRKANLTGVDLLGANLSGSYFMGADLRKANFSQTLLRRSNFEKANLSKAIFKHAGLNDSNLKKVTALKANFFDAYLGKSDMTGGDWTGTNFYSANFSNANLKNCNFSNCDLARCIFVRSNLQGANLENALVYGISVWDIQGKIKNQQNLTITPKELPAITVDELEMAQFIYLLVNNTKIRNAIDTISSKAVLILGRFYKERKIVLDALRDELRKRNYVPIVFDFKKPSSKDLTETVSTLAQMSRFVIADISDAKSVPQELSHIIPHNPSLPIVSIIDKKFRAYSMYEHFESYPWVLPLYIYTSKNQLIKVIKEKVIIPAEKKVKELKSK